jgi:hypothetical protein
MGREYKIKCSVPGKTALDKMLQRLPSPTHRQFLTKIYDYKIEADGFYFVDHLVDSATASTALRIFIDTALSVSESLEISEP